MKEIKINLEATNEVVGIWVVNMIREEIEETNETIKNEELWVLGAADEEEAEMHRQNIEELKEYLAVLEYAIKDCD